MKQKGIEKLEVGTFKAGETVEGAEIKVNQNFYIK